jgi:hypothetical protein
MTATHDDNPTTWRELADQLTDPQQSAIEGIEHDLNNCGMPAAQATRMLLDLARDHAQANLVDVAYSDVPLPAGISSVGGWEKNLKRDGWSRSVEWRKFG